MKKSNSIKILLASILFAAGFASAAPSATEVMQKMQEIQDQRADISAQVVMTRQKAEQGVKVYNSLFFRRDKDDSFLIINTAPESEKGNGYLKVGDNMWMYRRNTRTFQHINRDESISGTDVKAGDMEKRKFTELYKPVSETLEEVMLGKIPVYKMELAAKVNDVTYPKEIYWVRKDNYLPLKVEAYSLSGTLMQTAYYLQYTTIEQKFVMVKGIFVDEFEKGNKTIIEMSGISLNKIEDSIFTKAYLENLSK